MMKQKSKKILNQLEQLAIYFSKYLLRSFWQILKRISGEDHFQSIKDYRLVTLKCKLK